MTIQETELFAKKTAFSINSNRRIFALVGDLGAGKTTFSQFFLRALGVTESVTSPTFVIMKSYKLKTKNYKLAYHIDCYRLKNPEELLSLGFQEILADKKNIILIEWADRIRSAMPNDTMWIDFNHSGAEGERIISINPKHEASNLK